MKAINNNNRYYCHRRLRTGKVVAKKKTIYLPVSQHERIDKYAARLKNVYGYSIQLIIE